MEINNSIYKYSTIRLRRICKKLKITVQEKHELEFVMKELEKNEKHPLDLVLCRDFYPLIEKKFGYNKCEVESRYRRMIMNKYSEDKYKIDEILDCNRRPTLKKFIQLIFLETLI